jgi:hypothetical protein
MRRKTREPRPAGWVVHTAFVPRHDGPRRLEQAFRVLLGAESGAANVPQMTDEEIDHENCHLCKSLDREAGARPDD